MGEFPATRWTEIQAAQDGDRQALHAFVLKYRPAVVAYLRRRGLRDEAEDLAQEVFLRFLNDDVLTRADREKGRFRSLVLAVTRHVLGHHLEHERAKKRGGGATVKSLDGLDLASPEPDEDFDREWVTHLLEQALGRLASEHPDYHEALQRFLLRDQAYAEIAQELGCSRTDVKNRVYRGKRKVVVYLQETIRSYTASQREYVAEIRALSRLLPM